MMVSVLPFYLTQIFHILQKNFHHQCCLILSIDTYVSKDGVRYQLYNYNSVLSL